MKILNSPISSNFILNSLINGSCFCNPDVPAADYLVAPCRLGMVEVVCRVIELGYSSQSNGVHVPHNIRLPLFQSTTPFFPTSFELKLLGRYNAVLAVNNHELLVLDLIPILRLPPWEVSLLNN
jgi:hypothetical protein